MTEKVAALKRSSRRGVSEGAVPEAAGGGRLAGVPQGPWLLARAQLQLDRLLDPGAHGDLWTGRWREHVRGGTACHCCFFLFFLFVLSFPRRAVRRPLDGALARRRSSGGGRPVLSCLLSSCLVLSCRILLCIVMSCSLLGLVCFQGNT